MQRLAPHRLIDEIQLVVVPVALGSGRSLFDGVPAPLPFRLARSRSFRNGNTLLCCEPA